MSSFWPKPQPMCILDHRIRLQSLKINFWMDADYAVIQPARLAPENRVLNKKKINMHSIDSYFGKY